MRNLQKIAKYRYTSAASKGLINIPRNFYVEQGHRKALNLTGDMKKFDIHALSW